jgi:hypothetical protein
MSRVETIERQVAALSAKELSMFRRWFASFDAKVWDYELEADAAAGKLDAMANKAIKEHRGGKTSAL